MSSFGPICRRAPSTVDKVIEVSPGYHCSESHLEAVVVRFPSDDRKEMRDDPRMILADCAFLLARVCRLELKHPIGKATCAYCRAGLARSLRRNEKIIRPGYVKRTVLGVGAAGAFALLVLAQALGMTMLVRLERGVWQLRDRDDGICQRLCIWNGREFIQLCHRQSGCTTLGIKDDSREVTVKCTCNSSASGRTSIRQESWPLVKLQSQNAANGAPHSMLAEARRIGSC